MKCRVHILTVLAATVLAAGTAQPTDASSRTAVTVFRAFTAAGTPTIPVRGATGSCFTGSLTTSRSDAWRCLVGNYLYDPCFSSSLAPRRVICPFPNPRSGIAIRLTRPLPTAQANTGRPSAARQPWTLELFDGAHCSLASGATSVIHGVRLNYFCAPGSTTGLWGYPRRTTEPWTILVAPFTATKLSRRIAVEHAWM